MNTPVKDKEGIKLMRETIEAFEHLKTDKRLTEQEQKYVAFAWAYLYFSDCVNRKLEVYKQNEEII